jgi:hypothetical protein
VPDVIIANEEGANSTINLGLGDGQGGLAEPVHLPGAGNLNAAQ